MKKTQLKDALRNIKKQIVSFFSIVLVIMLGVGIFLACVAGAEAVRQTADRYYAEKNYRDLEIRGTKGITEEDVKALTSLDIIADAEGVFALDMLAVKEKGTVGVRVVSMTERFDSFDVLEGRAPSAAGECAVIESLLSDVGVKVGDRITVRGKTERTDLLKTGELTVVGVIRHPDHFRAGEATTHDVVITLDSVDTDRMGTPFTGIFVRLNTDASSFSAEYADQVKTAIRAMTVFGGTRSELRDEVIKEAAYEKFAEAEKQLDDARRQLDRIKNENEEASDGQNGEPVNAAFFAKMRKTLEESGIKLAVAKLVIEQIIEQAEALRGSIEQIINKAAVEIPGVGTVTISSVSEFTENYTLPLKGAVLKLLSGIIGVDGEKAELILQKLDESPVWSVFSALYGRVVSGVVSYQEGKKQYDEGVEQFENGKAQFEAAIAEKEEEYSAGLKKYQEEKAKFDAAAPARWITLTRESNLSWGEMRDSIRMFKSVGNTFALLFVILGALVCYATIGKIIDEQKKLVGATKAMGLYRKEIFGKYLIFGGLGAGLGAVLGAVISYVLLEEILVKATAKTFVLGSFDKVFLWSSALIAVAGALALGALATWMACSKLLSKPSTLLINGEMPKSSGKEKKHVDGKKPRSIYAGLIMRNIRTDIKRVIITVTSIAGCCMLLMTGFSLKLTFGDVISAQFEEIIRYDGLLRYLPEETETVSDDIAKVLDESGCSYTDVYYFGTLTRIGDSFETAQIFAADPDALPEFYKVYDVDKKIEKRIPDGGAIINNGLAETYSLSVGDHISIMDEEGVFRDVTVSEIYKNYAGKSIFLAKDFAGTLFPNSFRENAFMVKNGDIGSDELNERLSAVAGYAGLSD